MSVLGGVDYVAFLIPVLVMMTLLQNAFANSTSSILQSKIMGSIIFIELPPFSGWQLAAAFISASVVRGLAVGAGVFAVTSLWQMPPVEHIAWIFGFAVLAAALMASLGVICGLWADKYDQMGAFQSFVIMPLTFLSGVFYSVHQLPSFWSQASLFNPFFYAIDGFRYGFFGKSDIDPLISLAMTGFFCAAAMTAATALFVRGYKLKQ